MTAAALAPLRIEVLGPLRIVAADGSPRTLPGGKTSALIAYLATEADGAERDALGRLFWPDAAPERRRHSLRQALSSIRRAVGMDPFLPGERVALNPAVCASDFLELRDALAGPERERALALFRGTPYTDVSAGISRDFEEWLERNRGEVLQRLAAIIEAVGREAANDGDEPRVEEVIEIGVRAGLEATVLRAAVLGAHGALPPRAAATTGADALEALALRLAPQARPVAALVHEETAGWAEEVLRRAVANRPEEERPTVVVVDGSADDSPEGSSWTAGLLSSLLRAPGGAAVLRGTLGLHEELLTRPALPADPAAQPRLEAALEDALDAVIDEAPLVLVMRADPITLRDANLLARALSFQGGCGTLLVLCSRTPALLDGLAVQAVAHSCVEIRRVREVAPDPPATPRSLELPARHRARARLGFAIVGIVAVVAASATLGLGAFTGAHPAPSAAELIPEHDVLFCSTRSGTAQYYRWSPAEDVLERLTADPAPTSHVPDFGSVCLVTLGGEQGGDSIYLPFQGEHGPEWRALANRMERLDQPTRSIQPAPSPLIAAIHGTQAIVWNATTPPGVHLTDLATGETRVLRADPWRGWVSSRGHQPPWIVMQDTTSGGMDLYRIHAESGELQRLTHTPIPETDANLSGDSLIFSRGPVADAEDGALELYLLHLDTGEEERLTDNGWNDYEVRWSPDGRHICWQSEERGHYESEIMVMDLRSRRSWNLSRSPGRDAECRFTPDGRGVLYQSFREGRSGIVLQPLDGSAVHPLSAYPGHDWLVGFVRRVERP